MYGSWEMMRDGRTDRWKKWHIEKGAPPKKTIQNDKKLKEKKRIVAYPDFRNWAKKY